MDDPSEEKGNGGSLTLNPDGTFKSSTYSHAVDGEEPVEWHISRVDTGTYLQGQDEIVFKPAHSTGRRCKCVGRKVQNHTANCVDSRLEPEEFTARITRNDANEIVQIGFPAPDGNESLLNSHTVLPMSLQGERQPIRYLSFNRTDNPKLRDGNGGYVQLNPDGIFLSEVYSTSIAADSGTNPLPEWHFTRQDRGTYVESKEKIVFEPKKSQGQCCTCAGPEKNHAQQCELHDIETSGTLTCRVTRDDSGNIVQLGFPAPDGKERLSVSHDILPMTLEE